MRMQVAGGGRETWAGAGRPRVSCSSPPLPPSLSRRGEIEHGGADVFFRPAERREEFL